MVIRMTVIALVMFQGICQFALMTCLARNNHMLPLKFEICLVMIKFLISAYDFE